MPNSFSVMKKGSASSSIWRSPCLALLTLLDPLHVPLEDLSVYSRTRGSSFFLPGSSFCCSASSLAPSPSSSSAAAASDLDGGLACSLASSSWLASDWANEGPEEATLRFLISLGSMCHKGKGI